MRRLFLIAAALCFATSVMAQTPGGPADRKFVVFFQAWSGELDDSAVAVIADVATLAKANPGRKVIIRGFADPTGSARANSLVSALRAELVASQLVADGVATNRIEQDALGATEYAMSSQESRRVTIFLGGN